MRTNPPVAKNFLASTPHRSHYSGGNRRRLFARSGWSALAGLALGSLACSASDEGDDEGGGLVQLPPENSMAGTSTDPGLGAAGTTSTAGGSGGAGPGPEGGTGNEGGAGPDPMGGSGPGGTTGDGGTQGVGGAGGAAPEPSVWDRLPTAGCGKDPMQELGQFVQYTIPLTGETLNNPHNHTERIIHVWLPPDYDNMRPYRVVYQTVGCQAGSAPGAVYRLNDPNQGGTTQAIYVAMNLPNPPTNNGCYDNRAGINSIEWESVDHDHAFLTDRFCVDNNRVFTGGYSSGGWTSNMWSCYFGGIPEPPRKFAPTWRLRGAMGVSGGWVDGNPECNGPVGQIWIHDEADGGANPISGALAQRNRVLRQTGCEGFENGPTEEWGSDFFVSGTCLKYTNCPAEFPVIFCTTQGQGHNSQNANAIQGFTQYMDDLEPENRPAP